METLESLDIPVLVVDDGSTDETGLIVKQWCSRAPDRWSSISYLTNQGKAAALRTGFREGGSRGFTHVVSIDSDGQHDARDIPSLLALASSHDGAIIVGSRSMSTPGYPLRSKFGRWCSNLLASLASGVQVGDTQSGLRVYPLSVLATLERDRPFAGRYGFETDVLTRAGWHGVAIHELPISCTYAPIGGHTTHFRVFSDSMSAVGMHTRLLARGLAWGSTLTFQNGRPRGSIPRRLLWWLSPVRIRDMLRGDQSQQERFAASVGVGFFMASLPLYGIKTVMCLMFAKMMRLNPLVVIAISSLSTPPLGFVFAFVSILIGHLVLGRGGESVLSLNGSWASPQGLATMRALALEWGVGSVILGVALGLLSYWLVRVMVVSKR